MGLLDRLQQTGPLPHMSAHVANAIVTLRLLDVWTNGQALAAMQEHLNGYQLTAGEQAAFLEMITHYTALTTAQKGEYLHRLEGCIVALQYNLMTRADFKTLVGIITES